jgi:hypothetical protein
MGAKETITALGGIAVVGVLAVDLAIGEANIRHQQSASSQNADCPSMSAIESSPEFQAASERGRQQMFCNHQLETARAEHNYALTVCMQDLLPNGGNVLEVQEVDWKCTTEILPNTAIGQALDYAQHQAAMAR